MNNYSKQAINERLFKVTKPLTKKYQSKGLGKLKSLRETLDEISTPIYIENNE